MQRLQIDEQLRSYGTGYVQGPYFPPPRERKERGYGSDYSEDSSSTGGGRSRGRGGFRGRGSSRGRYRGGKCYQAAQDMLGLF